MKSYCALVLGMHRSGTSALARFLIDMGFDLPSEALPAHPKDNPGGYYESREIVQLNNRILQTLGSNWKEIDRLNDDRFSAIQMLELEEEIKACVTTAQQKSRPIMIKDPRICRLLPLWLPILQASFDHLAVLLIIRSADAVFESLRRRAEISDISETAITNQEHAYALWFRYYLDAFYRCRGISHHLVHYARWLNDGDKETRGIRQYLTNSLPGIHLKSCKPYLNSNPRPNSATDANINTAYHLLSEEICQQNSVIELEDLMAEVHQSFDLSIPAANQQDLQVPPIAVRAAALLKHATGFIRSSPKLERVTSSALSQAGRRNTIVYISQDPNTRGHIYRVVNMIDALGRVGIDAFWLYPEDAVRTPALLKDVCTVIIHRCDWHPSINSLLIYCQRNHIPVGFDIDDYLFDLEVISKHLLRFVPSLPNGEQQAWIDRISGYQKIIRKVDYCIATTDPLKQQLERFNRNVIVVANGYSAENLLLAKHWQAHNQTNKSVRPRVGYASGTPTHDADFATIAEPVAKFLQENSDWLLTIIGSLDLGEHRHLFNPEQLEIRPLVAHINFAYELARLDILLVPLETPNPFCDAKSPLKWYEAALAGTPSICVANPVFSDAINHQETGLLCNGKEEWYHAISALSLDATTRKMIADQAALVAKEKYNSTTCTRELLKYLSV